MLISGGSSSHCTVNVLNTLYTFRHLKSFNVIVYICLLLFYFTSISVYCSHTQLPHPSYPFFWRKSGIRSAVPTIQVPVPLDEAMRQWMKVSGCIPLTLLPRIFAAVTPPSHTGAECHSVAVVFVVMFKYL